MVSETELIILTALGRPQDIETLLTLSKKTGIDKFVIEDCLEAMRNKKYVQKSPDISSGDNVAPLYNLWNITERGQSKL